MLYITETPEDVYIQVIELKRGYPEDYVMSQIGKYIDWVIDYVVPHQVKRVHLIPVLVSAHSDQVLEVFTSPAVRERIKNDRVTTTRYSVEDLKLVTFTIRNGQIEFSSH